MSRLPRALAALRWTLIGLFVAAALFNWTRIGLLAGGHLLEALGHTCVRLAYKLGAEENDGAPDGNGADSY